MNVNLYKKTNNNDVWLRKIPYPYKAHMAICSDLDETYSKQIYFETMRFLNSPSNTVMGKGVDLEVGNTIYFKMPEEQFSYYNTDDDGREEIKRHIKSGHIDCIHSYGDYVESRSEVESIINELKRDDCRIPVWVDHAIAPSNFGSDRMAGQGDVKKSNVYHADLSLNNGIEFVWIGRVTSLVGQNTNASLVKIICFNNFFASLKTYAKQLLKQLLSFVGNKKYSMHKGNILLREYKLRDGRNTIEFIRSNPSSCGVSCNDTAEGFYTVLTKCMLDELVRVNGTTIIYSHLGKTAPSRNNYFSDATINAFKLLSQYYHANTILVSTTYRLLKYARMLDKIGVTVTEDNDELIINISQYNEDISGLSFYVTGNKSIIVKIDNISTDFSDYMEPNGTRNVVVKPFTKLQYNH